VLIRNLCKQTACVTLAGTLVSIAALRPFLSLVHKAELLEYVTMYYCMTFGYCLLALSVCYSLILYAHE